MKYIVNGTECNVLIDRKNNKNTYIKMNGTDIIVTTNYFTSDKKILKILDENISFLNRALKKELTKLEKENHFYYLGKAYDVIITPLYDVEFIGDKVYTKDINFLNKWLNKEMKKIYKEHLDEMYKLFVEDIPYPILKIRFMKTRWGVCNSKNNSVTLNSELIKYDISCLDYVIVHELSHFVHFDHSKDFWNTVEKHFPDYKKYRKMLKD